MGVAFGGLRELSGHILVTRWESPANQYSHRMCLILPDSQRIRSTILSAALEALQQPTLLVPVQDRSTVPHKNLNGKHYAHQKTSHAQTLEMPPMKA